MRFLPVAVTHYFSIFLFALFGLQMLLQARRLGNSKDGGEREGAEQMVKDMKEGTKSWAVLGRVASLIFVSEWMDRSMLATMALAASTSTVSVVFGASLANLVCSILAVLGATLVASKISERAVSFIAGLLFEIFAILTLLEGPSGN